MQKTFLIHYGEIGLKGHNRRDFENRLRRNIQTRVSAIGTAKNKTETQIKYKYLELTTDIKDSTKIVDTLSKTFGIVWFAEATRFPRAASLDDITKTIIKEAQAKATADRTFKVKVKRADKTFKMISQEIEAKIGEAILDQTTYTKVNLTRPDDEYFIEINTQAILVFTEKHRGPGGLPVGISGRVLVLFSGGIDSCVAAWMMAKRGCQVDYLHFYVNKPEKGSKIDRLYNKLAEWTDGGRLFLAPYIHFNMEVLSIDTIYELVLFRRFMLKIAERLCNEKHIQAIASGDSLGQVASQTLSNITAANDALDKLVCFRPLISMDKEDIIDLARRIGTFDMSNEDQKDCCSLIDHHAKTRVGLEEIRKEEGKIENEQSMIDKTMDEIAIH